MDDNQPDDTIATKSTDQNDTVEEDDLDEFLDGLESGLVCRVYRIEPSEFKGFLEEIDVTDTTRPINLNYLRNTWGGHKLALRFRRPKGSGKNVAGTFVRHKYVPLYSYPPLRYGKELQPYSSMHPFDQDHDGSSASHALPENKNNIMKEWLQMAQLMQQMRQTELQTLAGLMQNMMPQTQQQTIDPISQAAKMLGLMGKMQSLTRPAPAESEGDEVLGLVGKLADVFGRTQQIGAAPAPSLVSAHDKQPLPSHNTKPTPEGLIDSLRSGFLRLSPAEQGQAMTMLFGQLQQVGGDELVLSSLENLGIIEPDENGHDTDPRGESGPDEGDDPPDRQ